MTKCDIIKERVGMTELLERYGLQRFRGGRYLCCFHSDKNPSASVKDDKLFKCFACGVGFDVIDFVANYEKCDKKTAIAKIDEMFKLGIGGRLTEDQKAEMGIVIKKRQKEKEAREFREKQERQSRDKIINQLNLWREIQTACHPTRGEIRRDDWQLQELFLYSIRQQDWLEWVYCRIIGCTHPLCEFDFEECAGYDKNKFIDLVLSKELLHI